MSWCVYMLECSDGSYYTGMTNHFEKRFKLHQAGKAAKYTRSRLPVKLLMRQYVHSKSAALKLEARIKKLKRKEKEQFLTGEYTHVQ